MFFLEASISGRSLESKIYNKQQTTKQIELALPENKIENPNMGHTNLSLPIRQPEEEGN